MPKASVEELKGRIAAGEYAIDSGKVAGKILTDFALIRRVKRLLMGEGALDEATRTPGPRSRRRTRATRSNGLRTRRERFQ